MVSQFSIDQKGVKNLTLKNSLPFRPTCQGVILTVCGVRAHPMHAIGPHDASLRPDASVYGFGVACGSAARESNCQTTKDAQPALIELRVRDRRIRRCLTLQRRHYFLSSGLLLFGPR